MSIETVEQDFHRKVSQKIRLSGEGIDRFRVFTPFLFEDGDHLAIVLKREGARWLLSDEAHTYMHLTYDIDEKDLHRGTEVARRSSPTPCPRSESKITRESWYWRYRRSVTATRSTPLFRGCSRSPTCLFCRESGFGPRSWKISGLLLSEVTPEERRSFDWSDPEHDPNGMYTVDCRINRCPGHSSFTALPVTAGHGMPRSRCSSSRGGDSGSDPSPSSRIRKRSIARYWHGSAMYAKSSFPAWSRIASGSHVS